MKITKSLKSAVAAVAITLLTTQSASAAVNLTGAGSTFAIPLLDSCKVGFSGATGNSYTYTGGGSGAGAVATSAGGGSEPRNTNGASIWTWTGFDGASCFVAEGGGVYPRTSAMTGWLIGGGVAFVPACVDGGRVASEACTVPV